MRKKEELFCLIKSLSKSEKRHFRLFSAVNGGNNNYLKLFDVIASQQNYDEQSIKKKFKCETFINQLTTTKNYLKNLILKFLRLYYAELSKEGIIKDTLRNAEILYQKGLYQMSRFEAEKAHKLAQEYELFTSQYEALVWKKRILQAESPQQIEELNKISSLQKKVVGQLSEFTNIWSMNVQLKELGDEALKVEQDEPLQHKMFKRLFMFQQLVRKRRPDDAVTYLKETILEYDEKPHRKKEDAETYLILLNNELALYVYQKKYELAVPLIHRIKEFIFQLKNYSAPIFKTLLRTLNIELEIYRESKNLDKGLASIREIDVLISNSMFPVPESYQVSFWFQFANLYFMSKNYHQALNWVNILLNKRGKSEREDLITYAHWINLMIHFELKNFFVLRYFVESTRRYLNKKKKINAYEVLVLKLFGKIASVPVNELSSFFKSYQDKFQSEEYSIPKEVLDYVDFYSWLAEKAE